MHVEIALACQDGLEQGPAAVDSAAASLAHHHERLSAAYFCTNFASS